MERDEKIKLAHECAQQGCEYYNDGNYWAAGEKYGDALRLTEELRFKGDYDTRLEWKRNRAVALFADQEYDFALKQYIEVLDPGNPQMLKEFGIMLMESKSFVGLNQSPLAVMCFERYLAANPDDSDVWARLGEAWYASVHGEEKALEAYKKAAALKAEAPETNAPDYLDQEAQKFFMSGSLYLEDRDRIGGAVHDLNIACILSPKNKNYAEVYKRAEEIMDDAMKPMIHVLDNI